MVKKKKTWNAYYDIIKILEIGQKKGGFIDTIPQQRATNKNIKSARSVATGRTCKAFGSSKLLRRERERINNIYVSSVSYNCRFKKEHQQHEFVSSSFLRNLSGRCENEPCCLWSRHWQYYLHLEKPAEILKWLYTKDICFNPYFNVEN